MSPGHESVLLPPSMLMLAIRTKCIFKFMYVVWFLLLHSSTIYYLQHTIQDVAEQAVDMVARRCLPHFNINWIHIYAGKMHKRAFLYYSVPGNDNPRIYIFRLAVTVWFFVDDNTIARRLFSFRIFMMPNGSSAASIKYDGILPRVPIFFFFFALNSQAFSTINLPAHVCGRSIAKCISAHSRKGIFYKKWKTMEKSILKCWRICGDNANEFSAFP